MLKLLKTNYDLEKKPSQIGKILVWKKGDMIWICFDSKFVVICNSFLYFPVVLILWLCCLSLSMSHTNHVNDDIRLWLFVKEWPWKNTPSLKRYLSYFLVVFSFRPISIISIYQNLRLRHPLPAEQKKNKSHMLGIYKLMSKMYCFHCRLPPPPTPTLNIYFALL